MKRFALAAVASLFVVACQDTSTTPMPVGDGPEINTGFVVSNPPPPPIDSGAVGATSESDGSNFTTLNFSVTYMLNKPENTGWLKFNRSENDDADIDNSAAVKMTNGAFSGKGTILVRADGGAFIINLSQVTFAGSSFDECTAETAPTATDDGKSSCFNLVLDGVIFQPSEGGTAVKAGVFTLRPAVKGTDVCAADIADECLIRTTN
jgi:hypothetical protein